VKWALNGHDAIATVPGEQIAAMPRARGERPAPHGQVVPLVIVHGDANRAERLRQSEQPLDVPNAAVCIIVAHVRSLRLTRQR